MSSTSYISRGELARSHDRPMVSRFGIVGTRHLTTALMYFSSASRELGAAKQIC